MYYVIPFLMGFVSVLVQIVLLREFVTVFSGNELDLGITLSIWLTTVGLGSLLGSRFSGKTFFSLSFILIGMLLQVTLFSIHMVGPVLSLQQGEVIPFGLTLVSTLVIMVPVCLVLGAQFPVAVEWTGGRSAIVYGLEGGGAFFGGVLFTVLLSGHVDGEAIVTALSMVSFLAAVFVAGKKWLLTLAAIPLFLHVLLPWVGEQFPERSGKLIKRVESRYGEILVTRTGSQYNVYASGKLAYSYPDHENEELMAHVPLSLHAAPKDVLLTGGAPSVIGELLKYDLESVTYVEPDPEMIRVFPLVLNKDDEDVTRDRRVTIITKDARSFIKELKGPKYDVVILNVSEPSTANVNRFFTVDFFREVLKIMRRDGVVLMKLPRSHGYIGRRMRMMNGSIYHSLHEVFPFAAMSSEEYGLLFASVEPVMFDPGMLADRFEQRDISTEHFRPYVLEDAFDPMKVSVVEERVEGVNVLNTDKRPVAYLYSLMMWTEVQGGSALLALFENRNVAIALIACAFLLLAAVMGARKRIPYFTFFTTGYTAMAFMMIMILSYQAHFGYVYERIGLITASFMLGIAPGALGHRFMERPLRWLRAGDLILMILFFLSGLQSAGEAYYYLMACAAGLITGFQFSASSMVGGETTSSQTAGHLYAFDLCPAHGDSKHGAVYGIY